VLAASPDTTVITDLSTGEIVYTSPGKDILGFAPEDFSALGPEGRTALVHPDDRGAVIALAAEVRGLDDGQTAQARYRTTDATGQERWVNRRVTPFRRDQAGTLVQVLAVVRDVTELVEAEAALTRAAHHDSLTGLPNRAQLVQTLGAALTEAAGTGGEVAVLFIDLDGFKQVNDTGGHSAGDVVLRVTADRLHGVVRHDDVVARVGGDEFVIVVRPRNRDGDMEPDVRSCAASLAGRVAEAVGQPVVVRGIEHQVTASIGITYAGGAAGATPTSVDDVLHLADAAMYRAKEQGKNRYEVLDALVSGTTTR
jgi:diguanylate cyclase (GGDEF)-like protein/PAS domain S-box-containing protein